MSNIANIKADPSYTMWFNGLSQLKVSEINAILEDDAYVDRVAKQLFLLVSATKKDKVRDEMTRCNWTIAAGNLEKKPVLESKKSEVRRLSEEAAILCGAVEDKYKLVQSKLDFNLVGKKTAEELEKRSEATVNMFMCGEIEVQHFLDSFCALKTESHLMEVKMDRLKMLKRRLHSPKGYSTAEYFYKS